MMGRDFGSQAMARLMLPFVVGVFLAGGIFFAVMFLGLPWLWEHVNVIVK